MRCKACQVDIVTPAAVCPLCGGPLEEDGKETAPAYPEFVEKRKRYYFLRRMLLFFSVLIALVSVTANLLFTPHFWWFIFVFTGLIYVWAAIPHIFRKGGNLGGKVLVQVACASFLLVLLDWETSWRGWSVSFALPIVFSAGIVGVTVIIVANRTNWARYVMYQALLALLGFVPPILYLIGVANQLWAAFIPALLAGVNLAMLAAFGDRNIKNEFRRRFHF